MADFVKKLDTPDGRLAFTFNRIYTVKGVSYFISVFRKSTPHFFHMESRDGTWRMVDAPKPPEWICQYENELANFIEGIL
jgi:hypothetical protein